MSGSAEYRLTAPERFTFGGAAARTQDRSGPVISFRLAILFLLVLYSNISRVYPALETFRPALAVAAAAIVMMVVELAVMRKGFRLAWPQGYLLIVFLLVAGVSEERRVGKEWRVVGG